MDDFNRASTAQVSPNNTLNIPCQFSNTKNSIQASIPPSQIAPSWATKYKFVLKPSATTYDTIYSNINYIDESDGTAFYLLEGENANKVEEGDRLIVKRDNNGYIDRCVYATVLEKENKSAAFIKVQDSQGEEIEVQGGTFMKINPSNFSAVNSALSVINIQVNPVFSQTADRYPILAYPFFYYDQRRNRCGNGLHCL